MLHQVGLNSADELFDSIPRRFTLNAESEHHPGPFRDRTAGRLRATRHSQSRARRHKFPRRRRIPALHSDRCRSHHFPFGVFHCLHAIPAGNIARHTAGNLRIPDACVPVDRNGSGKRFDVRRLDRAGRSSVDGGARDEAIEGDRLRRNPSRVSGSRQHLRAARRD